MTRCTHTAHARTGGHLTSMVAASGTVPGTAGLRTAVAVAPVTDWRLYDSIYTERYMRTPAADDNAAGYDAASVLQRVAMLMPNYLLVHGTGDDNVHFQNSALWVHPRTLLAVIARELTASVVQVKTLVEHNIQFALM